MRISSVVAIVSLLASSAASAASAQGARPRGVHGVIPPTPGLTPQGTPLPPEAPPVARALAYKRSRWSVEGYSFVNAIQVPGANGGVSSFTTAGLGTHADYWYTQAFSATIDLTSSLPGSPAISQSVEAGTRYSPLTLNASLRPFFDVRATYMHTYDSYAYSPGTGVVYGSRYSRGLGGLGGAGVEYSLTHRFALTTEIAVMRNRMNAYNVSGNSYIQAGDRYWATSIRYSLGLRFSPVSALH